MPPSRDAAGDCPDDALSASGSPPARTGILLASQSPRRQELLRQIGVAFTMLPPDADEDVEALEAALPGERPADYVVRVCAAKAGAAWRRAIRRGLADRPALTADTTVSIDGDILGKPRDAADAAHMLARLAGRTHKVLTAVAVSAPGGAQPAAQSLLSVSSVRFAPFDAVAIARYVASGEPFGKAGGYGVQGRAAAFIARIEGSYSGIMGLPLFETAELLRRAGVAF
jgi:septum formation protein